MTSSIVITTRNRKDELQAAVHSALEQTPTSEVVVLDDGSTDGTSDMVRGEFPAAKLHSFSESQGYIKRRNQGAELASGDVIVSIDDDAVFSSPNVVTQTLKDFVHPRVGAVAIPYRERLKDNIIRQRAPGVGNFVTASFVGTAYAVRRDLFLALGGFREGLVHQGEEADFCLQLLDAGYVVKMGTSDPIDHNESPRRSFARMDYYGRRNDVLFAWHNVPWPYFPGHLAGTTLNGFRFAFRCGRPVDQLRGIGAGYLEAMRQSGQRRPVSSAVYRLQRMLKKRGPGRLEDLEKDLPSIRAVSPWV